MKIVDEACFAKNGMLSIGKTTPYKAVVGQARNLLQDFEAPNTSVMENAQHLHRARVRELALGTVVEQRRASGLAHPEGQVSGSAAGSGLQERRPRRRLLGAA